MDANTDGTTLTAYLDLLKRLDEPRGDCRRGELEIVDDPDHLVAHADTVKKTIGIMYEDPYVYLLRDAVLFPPKTGTRTPVPGAYIRMVYKNRVNGNPGIFTLTLDASDRLILNRTFRHSTRSWMLEGQGTIAKAAKAARRASPAASPRRSAGRSSRRCRSPKRSLRSADSSATPCR